MQRRGERLLSQLSFRPCRSLALFTITKDFNLQNLEYPSKSSQQESPRNRYTAIFTSTWHDDDITRLWLLRHSHGSNEFPLNYVARPIPSAEAIYPETTT